MPHRLIRPAAALALAALPVAAVAQTSQFYAPPKLLKEGTTTQSAPKGSVTVQVFVKRDGSVGTTRIVKASNKADEAAALEIARSSTYKPGAKDGKPGDFFYTMVLKFDGKGVASDASAASAGGGAGQLGAVNALLRAGKYDDARTQAQAYLTAHPGDKQASVLLGVADEFSKHSADAVVAFDAAGGEIPAAYKNVAAEAYGKVAADDLNAKNNDKAIAEATKSLAIAETVNGYYVRGVAYSFAGSNDKAIADLEKARTLAGDKSDASTRGALEAALAGAYLNAGQLDKANAAAADARRIDPTNTRLDASFANYYAAQASALFKAGKRDEAVATLEAAAQKLPSQAPQLYAQAANVLANDPKPDWKRVKTETDKGLAVAPNDPRLLFVAGVALGNQGQTKDANALLLRAKANVGADAALAKQIDDSIAALAKQPQK